MGNAGVIAKVTRAFRGALAASLLLAPGAWAAGPGSIVFPPDRALLEAGEIEVLGFRPASPAAGLLEVRGAGGTAVPFQVRAGVFRVPVTLAPGESTLSLNGAEVKVFATGGPPPPEGYSPADPHAVDNDCGDCHAVGKDAIGLSERPPALCAGCHDPMGTREDGEPQPVQHPPVEEGDCLACHKFHGRAITALPAAERRAVCFECHDDVTGDGALRMHGPVAKGDCAGCHQVHGGPEAALLPATGAALCVRCHKDPTRNADGEEWATPHPALDDGCETCHLPHAAPAAGMLAQGQAALCGDCHDGIVPEEGAPGVVHPPAADGECASCHNPHGSAAGKLLRAEGASLCAECHDDPSRGPDGEEWATPHPALDDGCPTCHLPHAGPQPALLRKAQAPLCFDCHDPFAATTEEGAALFVHAPLARGQCAGCHAPHGSAAGKLLKQEPPGLCFLCHRDPAKTPEGGEWATPHPALDDGCLACHLPHVAPARRLLSQAQTELCAGCHEDKNVDDSGEPWATPHQPVKSGQCASCHGPHGAGERALLLARPLDLCHRCHEEPHINHVTVELGDDGLPVSSSMMTLRDGFPYEKRSGVLVCTGCHRPHGSDARRLFTEKDPLFCSRCHRY